MYKIYRGIKFIKCIIVFLIKLQLYLDNRTSVIESNSATKHLTCLAIDANHVFLFASITKQTDLITEQSVRLLRKIAKLKAIKVTGIYLPL